jgi:hypothetical protein
LSKTQLIIELWREARTRFTANDLKNKVAPCPSSPGFLIRHIGNVELLFAKNLFGSKDIKLIAKTVIAQKDTGEWVNPAEFKAYSDYAFKN